MTLDKLDLDSRSQLYEKSKTLSVFTQIARIYLDVVQYAATKFLVFEVMLVLLIQVQFNGKEVCWCDFMKYTLNIVMCQDTCEPV